MKSEDVPAFGTPRRNILGLSHTDVAAPDCGGSWPGSKMPETLQQPWCGNLFFHSFDPHVEKTAFVWWQSRELVPSDWPPPRCIILHLSKE